MKKKGSIPELIKAAVSGFGHGGKKGAEQELSGDGAARQADGAERASKAPDGVTEADAWSKAQVGAQAEAQARGQAQARSDTQANAQSDAQLGAQANALSGVHANGQSDAYAHTDSQQMAGEGRHISQGEEVSATDAIAERVVVPEVITGPAVCSLAEQHQGKTVAVTEKPILIGRDPEACQLVFEEATPGVSGWHCQLAYNKSTEEFLLTDLRSTYGTFLAAGERLEAGDVYSLKAGESFYLGAQTNTLRVEIR